MARLRGRIVWFCASKGFGFITRDGGADVFCPKRAVSTVDLPRLGDGAEVEFEVTGPEGLQAERVALVAG